jgi:hypothetical protein
LAMYLSGNQLESRTEDVIVEIGSLSVQRTQVCKSVIDFHLHVYCEIETLRPPLSYKLYSN